MNICPFCQSINDDKVTTCHACHKKMYSEPKTEWRSRIDEVAKGYRRPPAKGMPHGVQKDAIQNGWGARNKNGSWGMSFDLLTGRDGRIYLTITDYGTTGLTGSIFADPDSIPDDLPAEERLARFENMNFSGENIGAGLYGRGKLIFQAASKVREIIYDSLTIDGHYRLGRRFQEGRSLRQFPQVLENDLAKEMLAKLTQNSLPLLHRPGTRITIVDPLDDLVRDMRRGDFLEYIEETWWEILRKDNVEITVVVDGKSAKAHCPDIFEKLASGQMPANVTYCMENQPIVVRDETLRVKRLFMAKANSPIAEHLQGLVVQRKGMKVGVLELKDMPPELEECFWGFIELDKNYEQRIEEAEDLEHYSFAATYASYRELKKYAQSHFDAFKQQLGYVVDSKKSADQKAKEALRQAQQNLNEIMADLGITGIGERKTVKRDITVSVATVNFPHDNNEVVLGDTISGISFVIRNKSPYEREVRAVVETRNHRGELIERLHGEMLKIASQAKKTTSHLAVNLKRGVYPNHEEVCCICRVENMAGDPQAQCKIPIFISMKAADVEQLVEIKLANIEFPRASNRVDFGETIRNIRYQIQNHLLKPIQARITLRTHDHRNDNQPIATLGSYDVTLEALASEEVELPLLLIDPANYGMVKESSVCLRCTAVSAKDQGAIEKGDKLDRNDLVFWVNRDPPGFGIFEDVEWFEGGSDEPRAAVKQGSGPNRWIFRLNLTHPHYAAIDNSNKPRESTNYIFELMVREALFIALRAENFEPFNNQIKLEDQPYETSKIYNSTLDKILATYYQR